MDSKSAMDFFKNNPDLDQNNGYKAYKNSAFPAQTDDVALQDNGAEALAPGYMSDLSADMMPVLKEYNTYFASNDFASCMKALEKDVNGHKLKETMFTASGFNWMRDAILSMQKFFLEDVVHYINTVVRNAFNYKISEFTDANLSRTTAYSAYYLNRMFTDKGVITIPNNAWAKTDNGYQYTAFDVKVGEDLVDDHDYACSLVLGDNKGTEVASETVKKTQRAYGYIYNAVTGNGNVTFYAWRKPEVDITVRLKRL